MALSLGKLLLTDADWDEWSHWEAWNCGIDRWRGMSWHFRRDDDFEAWALLRQFVVLASDEPFLKWRWVCPSKIAMQVFRASFPLHYTRDYQHEHGLVQPVHTDPAIRILYHRARPGFVRGRGVADPDPEETWIGDPAGAIEFLRRRFSGEVPSA